MRDIYLNKIVDLTDPQCEFISEFNREIKKYGAIVYNYDSNSYQFIRNFGHIDCKKEILPDFMRVENANALLNGLQLTIHYEFDPEEEEDEENLAIWNEEISQIELPVFCYGEDGEIDIEKYVPYNTEVSKHVVWFLNKDSYDFILDCDLLMLTPVIKNINVARELIKNYGVHPFQFEYDPNDHEGYEIPELYGVYQQLEEDMDQASGLVLGEDYCDEEEEEQPREKKKKKECCCCCGDDGECQCDGECCEEKEA
ncbi:MAG: hypothetical protein K6A14_07785 [Erysipelotrichaceae bacterium]|nr:hypothetical protein [Erysipelotrichaceae bacterium]